MAELLIMLMMAFNLRMVIYLTWERWEDNKAGDGKEKDYGMKGISDGVAGKSRFRMVERKPRAATTEPNAATIIQNEAVDEKDVIFIDETDTDDGQVPENKTSRQVPGEELDEIFSDSHVPDMAEYDGGEDCDGTPHEVSSVTFGDIDLAMRTVKEPKAIGERHRHAGMVSCDMKGNEPFALIKWNSNAIRRKLNELMDYYLDSVLAAQMKLVPAVIPKKAPTVSDNFEDLSIRDFI